MARRAKRRRKRSAPPPDLVYLPASLPLLETILRACWRNHRLRSHLYWSLQAARDAGALDPVGAWLSDMVEAMQDHIRMGSAIIQPSTAGLESWSAVLGAGRVKAGESPGWYAPPPSATPHRRRKSPLAGLAAGLRKLTGEKGKRRRRRAIPLPEAEVVDKRAEPGAGEWTDEDLMRKLEEVRRRDPPAARRVKIKTSPPPPRRRRAVRQADLDEEADAWEMLGKMREDTTGPQDRRAEPEQREFADVVSTGEYRDIGVPCPGPTILDELAGWIADDGDEIHTVVEQWREGYDVTVSDLEGAINQLDTAHHCEADRLSKMLDRDMGDALADFAAGVEEE